MRRLNAAYADIDGTLLALYSILNSRWLTAPFDVEAWVKKSRDLPTQFTLLGFGASAAFAFTAIQALAAIV